MTVTIKCYGEECKDLIIATTPEDPFLGPALLGATFAVNMHKKKDTGHGADNMRIESERSLASLHALGAIIQIFVNPLNSN